MRCARVIPASLRTPSRRASASVVCSAVVEVLALVRSPQRPCVLSTPPYFTHLLMRHAFMPGARTGGANLFLVLVRAKRAPATSPKARIAASLSMPDMDDKPSKPARTVCRARPTRAA
eukprot:1178168-Prorocentrum_minimum.AAC.4